MREVPTLPAMPQPARHVRPRWGTYYPGANLRPSREMRETRPAEPTFVVRRFDADTGDTGEVEVWADELNPDEIDAMSAEDAALANRWRDVADERDAEPVHNAEPADEMVSECAASAAE